MAMLSWNEIKSRAFRFASEWKDETREIAEAKTFWNEFFNIFGVSRRRLATFEEKVKTLDGIGYIDLLWKGEILIEHKSRGKNLERAYKQAKDYFGGLKEADLPKYILVSDFKRFCLYDMENGGQRTFNIEQLHENVELFGFIAGYQKQHHKEQDPVNIAAAEKMGDLHDKLKDIGYIGHDLEVYLVRLLFCLFADDTGIFEKNLFREYIEEETKLDGSDLALHIENIFSILNFTYESRLKNINDTLNRFPYVNGGLFEKKLPLASFDYEMRNLLLDCSVLDWGRISPAIFGSLFQSVMNSQQRRRLGAHYTSEENILKVINPLFMDGLWEEYRRIKRSSQKLDEFHKKISSLKFLDPACGCGNFLIIAYRELRLLEIEILRVKLKGEMTPKIDTLVLVNVDQFYGIEIDEFASQIASVALLLIDHQMNIAVSNEFGEYFVRLPLKKMPKIVNENALKINWDNLIPNKELNFILGNPPFVGSRFMTNEQKEEMKVVAKDLGKFGTLDYVSAWFIKAATFIKDTCIKVGLVSTNSIVQGEQAILLWKYLMYDKGVEIHFAHQTFKWNNETKGRAAVYCIIVGFSCQKGFPKKLFSYPDINGDATLRSVKLINQYLLEAPTIFITKRNKPISNVPPMIYGTMPRDGGHFLFTEDEMKEFIAKEPLSEKYFRPWIGGHELINGYQRYCLYLAKCPPRVLRQMPHVLKKVEAVRETRLKSKADSTRKWAASPTLLVQDQVTDSDILVLPRVTSEQRKTIPIGYFKYPTIASDLAFQVVDASVYLFGILNSSMHMAWMRTVCGRLKSDYRYSNTIVYNNFVFPEPKDQEIKAIEKHAKQILSIREKYLIEGSTLADLYDPIATPIDLLKTHQNLDKAVDRAYGKKFTTDEERVAHLFKLYYRKTTKKNLN